MRLAAFPKCYLDALCVERTMSVFDWIELARAHLKPLGVTGLEMYTGFLPSLDPARLGPVRDALAAAGFAMPMLCASPDFTWPDPRRRRAAVEEHRRAIDAAAALGAVTCRVLSGQRRPEVGEAEGIGWVVECIEALLPHAARRGVVLALENHFRDNYWTYPEFAQRADRFRAIVERIDSPWFGVNFDPSNTLLAGEDPIALLRRVAPRVVSMHASDRRPREGVRTSTENLTAYDQLVHGEVGTGLIDYDAVFGILREAGFDGWVSIEDGVDGIEELKRSARFLVARMGI
ncbi:MAG: sugar phosphate isomerase/epimerase [Chthonomonadales bacterium]|nr:sugar phosphate isomerase/epimerase [Chthonomonadales bacterium]